MAIYALADVHLSVGIDKPMDVFGNNWNGYMDKIKKNWEAKIKPEDTVLIAGDISWATYLEETLPDFKFIEELPGRKIISRGNHDYWWTTATKMQKFFAANEIRSVEIVRNSIIEAEDALISGTRLWLLPSQCKDDENRKIFEREKLRVELCVQAFLKADPEHTKRHILMLHYPPLSISSGETPYTRAIEACDASGKMVIDKVVYGHLHGKGLFAAFQGEKNGIEYVCSSADFLNFSPILV